MANIIRDARGVSDMELYVKDAIHRGERYIKAEAVIQLLEDLETMRREVYMDKNLTLTNQLKRQEIQEAQEDLDYLYRLQSKVL
jgi:hypothetical protein